ncbi:hypothetical protein BDW62DRAFT_199672 [Aspergillus aurantiobrunneus]
MILCVNVDLNDTSRPLDTQAKPNSGRISGLLPLTLTSEDKSRLQGYHSEKAIETVNETLKTVQAKQAACLQKRWAVKTKDGSKIFVRDIIDKIAFWVNKFAQVGDVAVQYDTAHASLPWAGIRFLLQIAINDLETFTSVAEGLDAVAQLVARYSIFEAVYLPGIGHGLTAAQGKLCSALKPLYSDLLRYLADIGRYYERSTGTRIFRSLFELSDRARNPLQAALAKEEEIEKFAQIVQADVSSRMHDTLQAFQPDSSQSFASFKKLLDSLKAPILRLDSRLTSFQDALEIKERRKLLSWLSGNSHSEYHKMWQWSSTSSILWIHGIPGCGKTTLASSIIQRHLEAVAQDPHSAPVAYVYCSKTNSTLSAKPLMALRSILRQLATDPMGDRVRKPVWKEFLRQQKAASNNGFDPSRLDMEECTELLLIITSDCPVTIILDGLDELDGSRVELLNALHNIINQSPSIVKIIISSRDDADIEQEMQDSISIRISPAEISGDITRFVQHQVDMAFADKKLLGGQASEALKILLIKTLNDDADVAAALEHLPPTLERTFEGMYSRIHSYGCHGKAIAMRVFSWLVSSQQPLSESELMAAVHSPQNEPAEQDHYDTKTILDLCCNFVALDDDSRCFFFVHASVREYLQSLPEYSLSMVNFTAAKRCLELFIFDQDDSPDSPFRQHAICNWAHHYSKVTDTIVKPELEALLTKFVSAEERANFQLWLEDVKDLVESKKPNATQVKELNTLLNKKESPIFLACVYGIPLILETVEADTVRVRATIDWDAKNAHGTPMFYVSASQGRCDWGAAFYGHEGTVRMLIENKTDLSAPGKFTGVLDAAMEGGHEPVIQLLLESSGITEASELEKVLLRASFDGHYEVVMKILGLLETGKHAGVETDQSHIHNTLQMALFQCRPRIARRLVKSVTDIRVIIGHFGNALHAAAFGGHATMATMVLEHGVDVNCRGRFGTSLRAAALRGHDAVARLLIDHNAGVEGKDANALQAAAFNGYTYGSKAAYSAFSAAVNGGQEVIVRAALESEPKIRDPDEPDGSEVLCSVGGGLSLLPKDDRIQGEAPYTVGKVATDGAFENPGSQFNGRLPWLGSENQDCMDQTATAQSVDANHDISSGNGRFLRMAARNGYVDVVKHLLDRGGNMDTTGNHAGPSSGQSSPIEVASAAEKASVVEYLLQKRARIGKSLSYARFHHPISVAVEWDFISGLDILLDFGRKRPGLVLGKGLVVATRRRNLVATRRILCGISLSDTGDDHSAHQCYQVFAAAAKQAALNKDMGAVPVLLEHTPTLTIQEKILSMVVRHGICESQWYSSLLEIQALVERSCYERLAGQALIALAASTKRYRRTNQFKEEKSAL